MEDRGWGETTRDEDRRVAEALKREEGADVRYRVEGKNAGGGRNERVG